MTAHAPAHTPGWMVRSTIEGMVAMVDGDTPVAAAVRQSWTANGGIAIAGCAPQAVDAAVARAGRLDVLVHARAPQPGRPLEAMDEQAWDQSLRDTVGAAFSLARACLPHLRASATPAVVHVTSLAGESGAAGSGAWGASQGALIALTRQMALEWAGDGVRVNAVNPGILDAPPGSGPDAAASRLAATIPMRRPGTAAEVANLIVFLASPVASFITAQVWNCDGGLSQSLYAAPMTRQNERT